MGPPCSEFHRPAMPTTHAFHRTTLSSSHRFVSVNAHTYVSRTYVSRRYGYGWRGYGYGVTGGIVGGGYAPYYSRGYYNGGYAYPYYHNCRWYYDHEQYNMPSWCRAYYGPSYGYVAPSYSYGYAYGSFYNHGYRVGSYWRGGAYHHYAISSSWHRSTQLTGAGVRVHGGTRLVVHGVTHSAGTAGHIRGHIAP